MSYMKNFQASAKSLVEHGVINIAGYGVPTSGTSGTGVGVCGPGSLYFDATNALLYMNTNTTASPTWTLAPSGEASSVTSTMLASASVVEAKLSTALQGTADGLGMLRVARATFNPSLTAGQRTIAAHNLGVTIPDNAVICGGFVDVITTFTSATDAATIALHAQSANDLVSAIAISNGGNPWDAGLKAIIPKANTPESTGIKLTAARALTATVASEALTAGKANLFVYYLIGD